MVLMHLVTGQNFKKEMVDGTIGLVESLYNAVDIKASEESDYDPESYAKLESLLMAKAKYLGLIGESVDDSRETVEPNTTPPESVDDTV
jgi:hypothetical protein